MIVFDVETDGLLKQATRMHTLSCYDTETAEYYTYDKHKVREGIKFLNGKMLVGHNIINFDIPVIQKLFPEENFKPQGVIDTAIMASIMFPDINESDVLQGKLRGTNKLEAWGLRLGTLKGDFSHSTDWKEWSPEMSRYCLQDVKVTVKLLQFLLIKGMSLKRVHKLGYINLFFNGASLIVDNVLKYSEKAFEVFKFKEALSLEQDVAEIIRQQIEYGFAFDVQKAQNLYNTLLEEREAITQKLQEVFPPIVTGYYKSSSKKYGYKKGDPKLLEFNPNSGKQVADRQIGRAHV